MRQGLIRLAAAAVLSGLIAAVLGADAQAVTIGSDARLTLPDFARRAGQDLSTLESRYAATGMVICNGTYSTAQLTVRNDLITTAAHAFYDAAGRPRGNMASCVFAIASGGTTHTIPIDAPSVKVGSTNPYALSPVHDWAVARLVRPVPDARPYQLGGGSRAGTSIVMLAHRHRGWVHDGRKAIENCAIRVAQRVERNSPREIAIDCSAGEGASGSAIMLPGSSCLMIGIYVGWRSNHPEQAGPFSTTHMNFGVAVEGPFRAAILAMTADLAAH